MRHKPKSRPDDGQPSPNNHQTIMREEYVETAARGFGLVHAIVSQITIITRLIVLIQRICNSYTTFTDEIL
ncbi:MAG: hypothetical protein SRB2_03692 [Desulfobacteraceae bacterium Eth-SRB2]|nr:MAG: hypothetical protein SRB2_03692 [Desulfobacteraceae bacterium Eth-SRB2]